MQILFITAHRLGDAVLSSASLAFLQEIYPTASFTIICGPDVVDIFASFPNIVRIIALVKRSYNRHWLFLWRKMILRRWDLIIDFRASLVSYALYAKKRYVIAGGRRHGHKLEQHWSVLSDISFQKKTHIQAQLALFKPKIWIDKEDETYAESLLKGQGNYVVLAPTAGSEDKIWPAQFYLFIARNLIERGYKIILLYGGGEREAALIEAFSYCDKKQDKQQMHDFGGGRYNLRVIAAILKRASLFIGNDSGLTHLASSFDSLPILALFGPTLAREYRPTSSASNVMIAPSLEGLYEDGKGVMALLEPEKVLHKALDMLKKYERHFG